MVPLRRTGGQVYEVEGTDAGGGGWAAWEGVRHGEVAWGEVAWGKAADAVSRQLSRMGGVGERESYPPSFLLSFLLPLQSLSPLLVFQSKEKHKELDMIYPQSICRRLRLPSSAQSQGSPRKLIMEEPHAELPSLPRAHSLSEVWVQGLAF